MNGARNLPMDIHADKITLRDFGEWILHHGEQRIEFCSYVSGFEGDVAGYTVDLSGTREVWQDRAAGFVLVAPNYSDYLYRFDGISGTVSRILKLEGRLHGATFAEFKKLPSGGVLLAYDSGLATLDKKGNPIWLRSTDVINYEFVSVDRERIRLDWHYDPTVADHPSRFFRVDDGTPCAAPQADQT